MKTQIYANLLSKLYEKANKSEKVCNFIQEVYEKLSQYLKEGMSENLGGIYNLYVRRWC